MYRDACVWSNQWKTPGRPGFVGRAPCSLSGLSAIHQQRGCISSLDIESLSSKCSRSPSCCHAQSETCGSSRAPFVNADPCDTDILVAIVWTLGNECKRQQVVERECLPGQQHSRRQYPAWYEYIHTNIYISVSRPSCSSLLPRCASRMLLLMDCSRLPDAILLRVRRRPPTLYFDLLNAVFRRCHGTRIYFHRSASCYERLTSDFGVLFLRMEMEWNSAARSVP